MFGNSMVGYLNTQAQNSVAAEAGSLCAPHLDRLPARQHAHMAPT